MIRVVSVGCYVKLRYHLGYLPGFIGPGRVLGRTISLDSLSIN